MMITGDEIPPIRKKVYQRALAVRQFSPDSIHNDEYTKQHGYPGALVSAYVLAGYVSELMVNLFGESWFTTGKYKLAFTGKGVQQGDAITCGGAVTGVEDLPGGDRKIELDVWIEKDGARPVLGQASGVLRPAKAPQADLNASAS
jgi:hypothetical protein